MDSTTPEERNKEVVDEMRAYLVECNKTATRKGSYCDTVVRITHQGGTIVEYEFSNPHTKKVKTK